MTEKQVQFGVQVISDEVVESRWAKFHRASALCTDEWGGEYLYHREFLDRGNAVAVLAYCPEKNSVLLVEQFRLPAYFNDKRDAILLELCGGMLEGQTELEAVASEVEEELGIELAQFEKAFSAYSSPGSITEKIEYYLARYSPEMAIPPTAGNLSQGERTVLREITYKDLHDGIRQGKVCDARTISLFYFLLVSHRSLALAGIENDN